MNESLLNRATMLCWVVFRLNLLVVASNVVLIGALLIFPFHFVTLPIYLLGAYLLVPSLLAMLLTLKRRDEIEKTSLVRLYGRCYMEEFNGSFPFASGYAVAAVLLFGSHVGLQVLPVQFPFAPIYALLGILLYVHFVFGLLIRVNLIIDIKGIWRLGMYCISRYPLYALFILGGTLILGALMNTFPIIIVVGAVPAAGFLLTVSTEKLFRELIVVLNISTNREDIENESKDDS